MFKNRNVYVLLVAVLIINGVVGKKSRRIKRPTDEEDTTPQPSVVSYSTFGFNDVGSYDGFVPTSPDYANFLSNVNPESTTRLYAPAFPSAADPTGYNNNFEPPGEFGGSDDNEPQSSMLQYPQSSVSFYNTPNFENTDIQHKNYASNEMPEPNSEGVNGAVYGAKIGSKVKKPLNSYNNSVLNGYSSGSVIQSNDYSRFKPQESPPTQETKVNFGESGPSSQNSPNYASNYHALEAQGFVKTPTYNGINFPRVIDFTKMKHNYPTELDNKYQVAAYSSMLNDHNENFFTNNNDEQVNKKHIQPTPTLKETASFNSKPSEVEPTKEIFKPHLYSNSDYTSNYIKPTPTKNQYKGENSDSDIKDNYKPKWSTQNNEFDLKNMRNPFRGYEYSTDFSNTSFRYDFTPEKKPFNTETDELVPASSNIDSKYNFPQSDYSNFKKIPDVKIPFDDDYESPPSRDSFKSEEFLSKFKNLYTTTPSLSSQWSNAFKSADSYKQRAKKPQFDDSTASDVVHIPKRQHSLKYNYGKYFDSASNDFTKQRPLKSNKLEKPKDWSKDIYNTRFQSEEDLLGLRNHDTTHPSYLPSNRPNTNDIFDDNDYKKIIEKWRQSYLKSKYREAQRDRERDYESYSSDSKPLHVPIPKPYPIEVPHPVIVPVPQPYPVRVPVPKPVAVPYIRELTVPIEKPVPYPVIKKVPYPVEKLVPVPVEKEVKVPVLKPYPVHIPQVRPVFHHSRPHRDSYESDSEEDSDYLPRPESSKKTPPYKKRPKSTRARPSRRPTRMTYHDRTPTQNKKRWPSGHRSSETRSRRPHTDYNSSYRNRNYDTDREYESEHSEYYLYCKRTGNC